MTTILEYVQNRPSDVGLQALDKYTAVGAMIRNASTEFKDSFSSQLETLLANETTTAEATDEPRNAIAEKFKASMTGPANVDATTCFTALAAPSLEGETQFAFVLRKVKPLYFPISEARRSFRFGPQPVYTNFTNLAKTLFECAQEDLRTLGNVTTGKEILASSSKELFTVGFLLKLIEKSGGCPCDQN